MQIEQDFKHTIKDVDIFTAWPEVAKNVLHYADQITDKSWKKDILMDRNTESLTEGKHVVKCKQLVILLKFLHARMVFKMFHFFQHISGKCGDSWGDTLMH